MSFHVGQKVVCVDDSPHPSPNFCGIKHLKKNSIYTVRGFGYYPVTGSHGLYVEELILPIHYPSGLEYAYAPRQFRPLRTTSIEVFQQMLVNPPKELV